MVAVELGYAPCGTPALDLGIKHRQWRRMRARPDSRIIINDHNLYCTSYPWVVLVRVRVHTPAQCEQGSKTAVHGPRQSSHQQSHTRTRSLQRYLLFTTLQSFRSERARKGAFRAVFAYHWWSITRIAPTRSPVHRDSE